MKFWLIAPVLTLLLAGCGGSDDSPADSTDDSTGAGEVTSETSTVEHQFGTTTLDGVPTRVVTLDTQWSDIMLALGVAPVGFAKDASAVDGLPWQETGDATALDLSDNVPLEQIAALEPDLILGTYSIADAGTYERLSGIAPTVPAIDERDVSAWRDLVALGGDLLDQQDEATALVEETDEQVTAVAEELPGLAGRTFALAQYVVGDQLYIVGDPEDGSSELFTSLGMQLHPPVLAEAEKAGEARVGASTERIDLLGADLLAFLVNGGDESDLADIPGFDALEGAVAVLDYATIVGLNTPSPLSIPYALEQLRPFLEEAATS